MSGKLTKIVGGCLVALVTSNYCFAEETINTTTTTTTTNPVVAPSVPSTTSTTKVITTTAPPAMSGGANSSTMTKDVWLDNLKVAVPSLICKGFLENAALSKQFATLKIDYDKCLTLIPASIEKCQADLYVKIPATIDDGSASSWGKTIGECIGKDFAIKYLL